jgi:two-component system alkaline phosphatase synthesis response regulator PhoP
MEDQDQTNRDPDMDLYQELFELSPLSRAMFDMTGFCLHANHTFSHWHGRSKQDLEGGDFQFSDLFNQAAEGEAIFAELDTEQIIRHKEVEMIDRDGYVTTMSLSGRRLSRGDLQGFDITFTPAASRKQYQRALSRDRARMTSLIEGMHAGLFLVNTDGKIIQFNRALNNLLALDSDEMVGKSYQELFANLIEDASEPELAQQLLSQSVISVVESPVVEIALERDGLRYVELALFPVWDEDGAPLGWGGLVQDVTEIRDRLSWKLELLSILAHDIRAPLATLKGHATALLANYGQWSDQMVAEFLEAIDRGTDKLVRQVDRSLALTRVEAGRLGLRPEAVTVKDLIDQSLERVAGAVEYTEVAFMDEVELPSVRADPARIEEVLINLLDNASRYSPPEEPIRIEVERVDTHIKISVIDRGRGIPEEKQQRIFKKYIRGEDEGGGTGLGLYISRKIIEAHGGQIWVDSPLETMGGGTRFSFTLPLMPESVAAQREPSREEQASITRPKALEGANILVVEDEPDFQALLRTILVESGYDVELAPDGPTAIEIVQTNPPDLVLLDWVLPGMEGLDVCKNIRRWSRVPILLVTSKTAQADLIAALDAGADDYITKPFKTPELRARIRALLRRGKSWKAPEPDRISVDGLLINFDSREVFLRGGRLDLTPTEFNLLAYLAKHRRQVLTYEQLLEHLYDAQPERNRHDLFVHISRLRKKIEPDPENPHFIKTKWGVGYIFAPK